MLPPLPQYSLLAWIAVFAMHPTLITIDPSLKRHHWWYCIHIIIINCSASNFDFRLDGPPFTVSWPQKPQYNPFECCLYNAMHPIVQWLLQSKLKTINIYLSPQTPFPIFNTNQQCDNAVLSQTREGGKGQEGEWGKDGKRGEYGMRERGDILASLSLKYGPSTPWLVPTPIPPSST